MTTIIETQYFPSIYYLQQIVKATTWKVEACEHYQKQTYRNRCYVLGANKVELLSVPVSTLPNAKTPIQAVELTYQQRWQIVHWRTIQSAYGKSPFFEYYEGAIRHVFFQEYQYLFDLNQAILKTLLGLLQFPSLITTTTEFIGLYPTDVMDLRNTTPLPGTIIQPKYLQVFGNQFISNLSVLDLLFCKGNQAKNYLLQ